ncbi:alpha/beta hydrolase [candidate division WWE3 bacterium]|uniref:Alpha/beta hydrolase n=1 Tax=candidate division WWE3 bacterium TaxID=2053526 RepID=A0A955LL47_UNCKA|nr:alpha/beta hydrolase [candidate division WWE3 bacterium]
MSNAILIHGTCSEEEYFSDEYPSLSNSHWFPWLQKQLLIRGIHTETPEMPDAYQPDYEKWKNEFERFEVNDQTILVGHSCGGGFLVRWLTENAITLKTVILVAPWLDPDRRKTSDFFEFDIDPDFVSRVSKLKIFVSNDDEPDILESVQLIKNALPNIEIKRYEGMGHFTEEEMKKNDFPELLNELV